MVLASSYGFSASATPADNGAALQAAVDAAFHVELPEDGADVSFEGPIIVRPGTRLTGASQTASSITCTTGTAFLYHSPASGTASGVIEHEGPVFADFALRCAASGIQLNDPDASFVEGTDGQGFIKCPRFERLVVSYVGEPEEMSGTFGINVNKCFSSVVDQCVIVGFQRGYWGKGSDFETITNRTRIWQSGTLITTEHAPGTFLGSGILIEGADLLIPTHSFLKSSNNHLMVRDSYFEKQSGGTLTGPVFEIAHRYITSFERNRMEVPAIASENDICPTLLDVTGEGMLFEFVGNTYGGPAWGEVTWNGGTGSRYLYTPLVRQKIAVRENRQDIPSPFVTQEPTPIRNERRDLWILSPATGGFVYPFNYAETCRVEDGAFVLPAAAGYGSLVQFRDAERPVSGTVNIYILAKGGVSGQSVAVQPHDIGAPAVAQVVALSDAYKWHSVVSNATYTNLGINVWNGDTANGSAVYLKQILVERA